MRRDSLKLTLNLGISIILILLFLTSLQHALYKTTLYFQNKGGTEKYILL